MTPPAGAAIALVDDEPNLRETVGFALRREGYRVELYADGLEAWQVFERGLPDLAILDILMPRMDGLELCRRLRALSERLPILFLAMRSSTACWGSSWGLTTTSASRSRCASWRRV
jgi:two-component system response regulator MprA